ncbi:MAG: NAD(P)-dependent dehydrogenase (short-subunit alcohol dehydrogenase family) [Thermoproteota archaeon]|jgi:NAD(P)-dependent dehydrogenase (short-subunit alcohol dehydrogenase family)
MDSNSEKPWRHPVNFELSKCKNILIIGGGHGIGLALIKTILEQWPKTEIIATYRISANAVELFNLKEKYPERVKTFMLDPTNQSSMFDLSVDISSVSKKLDLIINCVGLLHDENHSPEKSVRTFDPNSFMEVMRVNTVVTPLLAKYFEKFLKKNLVTALITLSAKVGSIGDNKLGGWHSYRASKAALNMLVKNISIEFARKRNNCIVLALHPGTTDTNLSRPFSGNTSLKVHAPEDTAKNILNVINQSKLSDTGSFFSWDGAKIEW